MGEAISSDGRVYNFEGINGPLRSLIRRDGKIYEETLHYEKGLLSKVTVQECRIGEDGRVSIVGIEHETPLPHLRQSR